jgi:predicted trehalose synthase
MGSELWADPASLAEAIRVWLPGRRWFAAKDRAIEHVSGELVELPDATEVVMVIADVALEGGDRHRYAIPVQLAAEADPSAILIAETPHGFLVDAMSTEKGSRDVVAAAVGPTAAAHRITPVGGEQSNSSVIVGRIMIAKLVRRLEPGVNPDVEVPRHLSRVGFAHAPGLIGHFDVELGDGTANAVIVHDAIPNEGDLWKLIGEQPDRASDVAELLGRRTAELHMALATSDRHSGTPPSFWPEPATLASQRAELEAVRSALVATQALLGDRSATLAAPADEVLRRFERLSAEAVHASRIRIHGDLHLGQILWTRDDVVFIDFEGEPARPMADRAAKRSGLVDVAGLMRSFDYAARNAGRDPEWASAANGRLLDAYLATIQPPLISRDREEVRLQLDLYMLEKALYEIRYELAHRPDWLEIPLAAAEALIG